MLKTIEQIAADLKVPKQTAYGLMSFLKAKNAVVTEPMPPNGKRGVRANLYQLRPDTIERLSAMLQCIGLPTPDVVSPAVIDTTPLVEETCVILDDQLSF